MNIEYTIGGVFSKKTVTRKEFADALRMARLVARFADQEIKRYEVRNTVGFTVTTEYGESAPFARYKVISKYDHYCEKGCCIPLGHYGGHDLYYCDAHGDTVIARYSSEGGAYKSGLCFAAEDKHLFEAARRARSKGLLSEYVLRMYVTNSCNHEEPWEFKFMGE
jgi:hypothetical protein